MELLDENGPVVVWTWRANLPADSGHKTAGWREVPSKMDKEAALRFAASEGISFERDMYRIPGSEEIRRG
jgi:hypothetical protein